MQRSHPWVGALIHTKRWSVLSSCMRRHIFCENWSKKNWRWWDTSKLWTTFFLSTSSKKRAREHWFHNWTTFTKSPFDKCELSHFRVKDRFLAHFRIFKAFFGDNFAMSYYIHGDVDKNERLGLFYSWFRQKNALQLKNWINSQSNTNIHVYQKRNWKNRV